MAKQLTNKGEVHAPTLEQTLRPRHQSQQPTPQRLWVIIGATGTGKSDLALDLAERLAASGRTAEIVNADAMQLYAGMMIGTAQLRPHEHRSIPHHLFDVVAPSEEATVAWYQPRARTVIEQVNARGHDAILVGGSGLYVSSVLFHFRFAPRDEKLRARLEAEYESSGIAPLLEHLHTLSPDTAENVDSRNPRRVVRALEIALLGGNPQLKLPPEPEFWHTHTRLVGIVCERAVLVERLDRRVERMWADGLLDEVRELMLNGLEQSPTASRAIGYAQAISQLRGELSEADAIAQTQRLTRRYARRQVSWFSRYPQVRWCDSTQGPVRADQIELN